MKFPALLLGFALVCSLSIAGYIHSKRKHEINLNKQASFLDIKFRVTRDVLGEYQDQLIQANTMMDKTKKEVDTLTKDLSDMKNSAAKKKTDVDTCNKDKKRITSDTSSAQSEKTKIQKEFVKEKSRLEEEIAGLKKQTEQQSKLCNYIDKTSAEGRKLCGLSEEPQKPEAKAEEPNPKPEEPKAEEPKAEEPKAEEPKAEEPKAEEPKAEEPKPKPEEPKAEEPKAEEPKPKPEEPKAEQPKVDVQ